jgi:hypothetical protein
MNIPGFNADASLIPSTRSYRKHIVSYLKSVPRVLAMQGPSMGGRLFNRSSQTTPAKQCYHVHSYPVCYQRDPFTECCTGAHEVVCKECSSPTDCCTTSQKTSCSECHSIFEVPTEATTHL